MFFKKNVSENTTHQEAVDDIDAFFEDDDKPIAYPKFARFIAIGTTVALIAHVVVRVHVPTEPPADFRIWGMGPDWLTPIADLIEFIAVGFIALAASLVAIVLINRRNLDKIRLVKNLTQRGAMEAVLKGLRGYNHKYTQSKNIELVFERLKVADSGFGVIKCTQTIRQRMPLHRKEFILDFIMLDRESDVAGADFVVVDLQSDAVPDDAHTVDITDIRKNFPNDYKDMFPGLIEVIVDNQPYVVNGGASQQPYAVSAERVSGRENHRRWRIDTKKHLGGGPIDVMYRYSYYYEATGFAFFEASEPTKGFFCGLNYHGVADDISVYFISNLNSRIFGLDVGKAIREDSHRLEVSTSDWIIPRSMVVFCWYSKGVCLTGEAAAGQPEGQGSPAAAQPAARPETAPTGQAGDNPDAAPPALTVDGNCLGVALLETFTALEVEPPQIDYAVLSTRQHAIAALRSVGSLDISFLVRSPARLPERLLLSLHAARLGMKAVRQSEMGEGEVALCLRSMRQLYGIPKRDGHWVIVRADGQEMQLVDKLEEYVLANFPDAVSTSAEAVLGQPGHTFRISLK